MTKILRFDPSEELEWLGKKTNTPYVLDFLYFFLEDETLATPYHYSRDYLKRVEQITSRVPKYKNFPRSALRDFKNYWYFPSYTKENFLQLSSKVYLSDFILKNRLNSHYIKTIKSSLDIFQLELENNKKYILKEDHHFAGRGNKIGSGEEIKLFLSQKCDSLNPNQFVIEEYLNRILDFSIAFINSKKIIIYENKVNKLGQYVGTIIDRRLVDSPSAFFEKIGINKIEIDKFNANLKSLTSFLASKLPEDISLSGSVDFFIYKDSALNEWRIHPGCEFNARWTMGRVAWALFQKFSKPEEQIGAFEFLKKENPQFPRSLIISPSEMKIKYAMSFQ